MTAFFYHDGLYIHKCIFLSFVANKIHTYINNITCLILNIQLNVSASTCLLSLFEVAIESWPNGI